VAYIFNFAKYVKWPKEGSAIVIGIYGEVKNIEYWKTLLSEKRVRNKVIQLRQISTLESLNDVNIIYVPENGSEDFKLLTAATAGYGRGPDQARSNHQLRGGRRASEI
jgi:hypothetical protein